MNKICLVFTTALFPLYSSISHSAPVTNPITWIGAMNVWNNDGGARGSYLWYSAWVLGYLKTTVSGTNNTRLTLQPNFNVYNATDPYWANGAAGNKWMEANTLVETDVAKLQSPAVFSGTIHSNTLASSHKAKAFIKILDPADNWSLTREIYQELPVTNGPTSFSVTLDLTSYTKNGLILQYGFLTEGINANPANETALGKADVTVTNIPTVLANAKIRVSVAGQVSTNNQTHQLLGPLINSTSSYVVTLENIGGQSLMISNTVLSNTVANSFSLGSALSNVTIPAGSVRSLTVKAAPTGNAALAGFLTITSSDATAASIRVNLEATPVALADNFASGTPAQLGWTKFGFVGNGPWPFETNPSPVTVDTTAGTLKLDVDEVAGGVTPPWRYGVQKAFVSPGPLNLAGSSLAVSLKASGSSPRTNKVQVYLESLSPTGQPTGRLSLGQWIDETSSNYYQTDGVNDRVAILLPEGGGYTTRSNSLASLLDESTLAVGTGAAFDRFAPAFRVVVQMTDFEFDDESDTPNLVNVDFLNLNLVTDSTSFELANGGFESNTSMGTNSPKGFLPAGWLQWARNEGANKVLMSSGSPVYDQSLTNDSPSVTFQPRSGSRALKVFPQYDYATNIPAGNTNYVWQSDWGDQKGVVYQEWNLAAVGLQPGDSIHAQVAAKVFSIDPLTGGSALNFGFRYLNGSTLLNADNVITLTASNATANIWRVLTANGTVPAGATTVQLISEFVQTSANDNGSVYLDDASVGRGAIDPATNAASGYVLTWADEFDGSSLNTNNWTAEVGRGPNGDGWGNGEQQYYTSRTNNLRVANGTLVIQAHRENYLGSPWTSARIKTQNLRSFQYGKIEFRAKLPSGIGPWPAAWLLGTNISSVNWPQCGEIDVMEWRGYPTGDANTIGHALHSSSRHSGDPVQPANRTSVANPATEFHTYGVVWTSNNLVFTVDGVDRATLTPPSGDAEAFRKEFFILLNLAIGGSYLQGQVDGSLTSATYEIDYVRVYQDPATLSLPTDTTPPVITLLGTNPVSLTWGATYADAGATAFDAGDNANVAVSTNNPVNTAVPGSYLVTYTATDSKSNTATAQRTVNVAMANGGTNRGTDGLTDLLRYAFGGTGTSPLPTSLLPSNSISGGNLVLTYYARTNTNVTLTPMVSADLANSNNWTNTGVTVITLTNLSTNGTILEKRQASTPATGTRKFLRLKATSNP